MKNNNKKFTTLLMRINVVVDLFLVCAIFLTVTVSAQTSCPLTKTQGDANCDAKIDLIDYESWRREFIGTLTTRTANFNTDTVVDLIDYEVWRRTFVGTGSTPTPTPTTGAITNTPTPTPPPSTGYKVPLPANYPLKNANDTYYTTLGVPDSIVKWRTASTHLWNQPLPATTPLSPNSASQVSVLSSIVRTGAPLFGYGSDFEYTKNAPYMYFVDGDKEQFVQVQEKCNMGSGGGIEQGLNNKYPGKTGIPFPAGAKMNPDSDYATVVYDYKYDLYFEFWDSRIPSMTGGPITACSGYVTENYSKGTAMTPSGATNAGIPHSGMTITLEEAYKQQINHVIGFTTAQERGDQYSYPASQWIAVYNCATPAIYSKIGGIQNCIFDGQRLRLPSTYDTSKISHPLARAVAEAMKKYGMIVMDYSGCNCLQAESGGPATATFGLGDPWQAAFNPVQSYEVYSQIPWESLEVLPQNWGKP